VDAEIRDLPAREVLQPSMVATALDQAIDGASNRTASA
jgi:hypothetical protein